MRLGFDLCFEDAAQLNGIYRLLFDNYVKFTPEYITYNRRAKQWNEKRDMQLLDSYDSEEAFAITSGVGMFLTSLIHRLHSYRSISITQDMDSFLPTEEDVHSIVDRPGFIAAYLYNEEYEAIQTTPYESNHMGREFSADILASIPYATSITQLSEDIVFVQLYDKVEEPYTPDNVFKQWKWREWLDYEGLEENYPR